MAEITSCPDCFQKLRLPDDLVGQKVRCPGCQRPFIARVGAGQHEEPARPTARAARGEAFSERRAPPADRDEDDRPHRSRRDEEDDRRGRSRHDDFSDRQRERERVRRWEEDDEDYPRSRPRDPAGAWRGVRLGLNLAIIAGWLTIALFFVAVVGAGIFMLAGVGFAGSIIGAQPNQMPGRATTGFVAMGLGLVLFFILMGFLLLVEMILRLTGYGLCMQVPAQRNSAARGLAIAAFSCAAGAVFLNLVGAGMSGFGGGGRGAALILAGGGNIFGNVAALLALAGFVCWLIFLRSVALQLRGPEVAGRIIAYIITSLLFGAIAFVMMLILVIVGVASVFGAAGANSATGALQTMGAFMIFAIFMGGLLALGSLALYVWYILLVTQVRNLVDRHLSRP
jgi:hypothetical protein